jgi:hypothetical protein
MWTVGYHLRMTDEALHELDRLALLRALPASAELASTFAAEIVKMDADRLDRRTPELPRKWRQLHSNSPRLAFYRADDLIKWGTANNLF